MQNWTKTITFFNNLFMFWTWGHVIENYTIFECPIAARFRLTLILGLELPYLSLTNCNIPLYSSPEAPLPSTLLLAVIYSFTRCFNEFERGVYWFHAIGLSVRLSVRLSVLLWTESCPLCNFHSTSWIHFISIHLIKQLQKVCRMYRFFARF